MHVVYHQYRIVFGNATEHVLLGQPRKLVPTILLKYGWLSSIRFLSAVCFITWEMQNFLNQFLVAWENAGNSIPSEKTGI